MKILVRLFLLPIALFAGGMSASAQCTADAGPDQVLSCLSPSVTLSGSSDIPGATFQWSSPAGFNSNVANPVVNVAGTYTLTITNPSNGCTATDAAVVTQAPDIPSINIAFIGNVSCFGASNGSIDLTVSGGTPGYSYLWSNGATVLDLSGLAAGVYTVIVTDAAGCTITSSATVTQPPAIVLSFTQTNVTCFGGNTGAISLDIFGATVPFLLAWSGPNGFTSTSQNPVDLSAGAYTITVTDSEGCSAVSTVILTAPAAIVITSPVFCDWEVGVQATGGSSPFQFAWSNGAAGPLATLTPGNYSITVTDTQGCTSIQDVYVPPIPIPCTKITGKVKFDLNEDCVAEDSETSLVGWLVRAIGAETYYGITDTAGTYEIRVKPGDYAVSAVPPANMPVFICQDEIGVSLPLNGDEATADFAVQDLPECPAMTVDLTAPVLRRCLSNNYYYVHYCNTGPVAATDAYIDLQLDPNIVLLSAVVPYNSLGNNLYRFNLGTVGAFVCSDFNILVYVSCQTTLGQSLCSEVHIYPDTLCVPVNPLWSGAKVELNANCDADSLHFILKNTGFGTMTTALDYIVIEDGIMGRSGTVPPLLSGDSMEVVVPANGSTWRLEANQELYFPGQSVPVLSVEGCPNTGVFSTGFLPQFPVNDADQWVDVECTTVTGSYDPNDKQGFPIGYGINHYIKPGLEIEYLIRFQNTGTDTAFHVVILDTLSAWFDPVTIRPGASSHPYELLFNGPGVLAFDFQNIILPDSNHNEAASHGFVKFRIAPRSDVPLNSDIFNSAAIYFDFNEPIITNTTRHRIGENFVIVGAWYPQEPEYQVQIAPNPFQSYSWITLSGAPPNDRYVLSLYKITGNLIKTIPNDRPQFRLEREGLSCGVYVFKIERNGEQAGWGKIVVGD